MYKTRLRTLLLLLNVYLIPISQGYCQNLSGPAEERINRNFELVRAHFTGDQAYNTVAFVEKYWRIAGNPGFDSSIQYVADKLKQAGYVMEDEAGKEDILTYRIEKRPLNKLSWEPLAGSLEIIVNEEAREILNFSTNRNMIAVNSWSTKPEGVEAELVFLTRGLSNEQLNKLDLKGKIVFAEQHPWRLYNSVIKGKGAAGLIVYTNPDYLEPEINQQSIQFISIPQDTLNKSWAIATSFEAKEILLKYRLSDTLKVRVKLETRLMESEELTLVADIKGQIYPDERIVYSAHVQEPGANDNASGVGAQTEMAIVISKLIRSGQFSPDRSMTFLFGDEIVSTRRYIQENKTRAEGIKWGISLDMVGENTKVTGGSFLIEKMPDPSAIWTRGEDKHTEWGGSPIKRNQLKPGYFNDFVIDIFKKQGRYAQWEVNTNPYEGGSDHVPFLRADIPGLLLWHFTDAFYHTDGDRLDKVSSETLNNVGTGALVAGMTLVNNDKIMANYMMELLSKEARARLMKEFELSKLSLASGGDKAVEEDIIATWTDYYKKSIESIHGLIPPSDIDSQSENMIKSYQKQIEEYGASLIERLDY